MASEFVESAAGSAVEGDAAAAEDVIAEQLEHHGQAFAGFLGDVQANVLNSINAQSVGPEGFVENFQGDCYAHVWRCQCFA